jgi:hypothetical protein
MHPLTLHPLADGARKPLAHSGQHRFRDDKAGRRAKEGPPGLSLQFLAQQRRREAAGASRLRSAVPPRRCQDCRAVLRKTQPARIPH